MRSKAVIIILVLVCVLLGVALLNVSQRSKEKQVEYVEKEKVRIMTDFSNDLGSASARLEEYRQVNIQITNQLDTEKRKVSYLTQTNEYLKGALVQATAEREDLKVEVEKVKKAAADAAELAEREIARHTAKVTELEKERDTLTRTMEGLTNQIAVLEIKIAETEKRLTAADHQNDFLLKELSRLRSEKAELERQFNDLKTVKDQVKKLTEEHNVALRLEWMRRGLYQDMKGGERMMRSLSPKPQPAATPNLDVEMKRSGGATIKGATNAPAAPKK
jgi:chromosome segregation ATPase